MLDRAPLHSPDEGLSPTARDLLIGVLAEELDLDAQDITDSYLRREGMRDIYELDQKLAKQGYPWLRLGPGSRDAGVLVQLAAGAVAISVVNDPTRQLQQLPDAHFLAAIEHALRERAPKRTDLSPNEGLALMLSPPRPVSAATKRFVAARDRIALLLRVRLLPYAIDELGRITWTGEPAMRELAIAPALAALAGIGALLLALRGAVPPSRVVAGAVAVAVTPALAASVAAAAPSRGARPAASGGPATVTFVVVGLQSDPSRAAGLHRRVHGDPHAGSASRPRRSGDRPIHLAGQPFADRSANRGDRGQTDGRGCAFASRQPDPRNGADP